jgi:hypothetical protein
VVRLPTFDHEDGRDRPVGSAGQDGDVRHHLVHDPVKVELFSALPDAELIKIVSEADKVGVNCPFGWPEPFVVAVSDFAANQAWPTPDDVLGLDRFALRNTDLVVKRPWSQTTLGECRPHRPDRDALGIPAEEAGLDRSDRPQRTGHGGLFGGDPEAVGTARQGAPR